MTTKFLRNWTKWIIDTNTWNTTLQMQTAVQPKIALLNTSIINNATRLTNLWNRELNDNTTQKNAIAALVLSNTSIFS